MVMQQEGWWRSYLQVLGGSILAFRQAIGTIFPDASIRNVNPGLYVPKLANPKPLTLNRARLS